MLGHQHSDKNLFTAKITYLSDSFELHLKNAMHSSTSMYNDQSST